MARKKKTRTVKAWVGLCDGKLYWFSPDTTPQRWRDPSTGEIFRTREAAEQVYEDVRRVTLIIEESR